MSERMNCPRCTSFNKINGDSWPFCNGCHHRVDVVPEECDCPMCWKIPDTLPEVRAVDEQLLDLLDLAALIPIPEGGGIIDVVIPPLPAGTIVENNTGRMLTVSHDVNREGLDLFIQDPSDATWNLKVNISPDYIARLYRAFSPADDADDAHAVFE